jgi:hypothetical protein
MRDDYIRAGAPANRRSDLHHAHARSKRGLEQQRIFAAKASTFRT